MCVKKEFSDNQNDNTINDKGEASSTDKASLKKLLSSEDMTNRGKHADRAIIISLYHSVGISAPSLPAL